MVDLCTLSAQSDASRHRVELLKHRPLTALGHASRSHVRGPFPPPCQPPPGPRTSLASSAFRLDCPSHPSSTSVDQNAEACPNSLPLVLAVSESLCFSHEKEVIRMYHQTYRILQLLELSGHTLLGFSFLIGTFNQQYRLFILSFIRQEEARPVTHVPSLPLGAGMSEWATTSREKSVRKGMTAATPSSRAFAWLMEQAGSTSQNQAMGSE